MKRGHISQLDQLGEQENNNSAEDLEKYLGWGGVDTGFSIHCIER